MPFDLDATTHTLTKTDEGGIQLVTADDPNDSQQAELIRQHLKLEAEKFSRGEFDDPAKIHGMDMPGVQELSRGHQRIMVTYTESPPAPSCGTRRPIHPCAEPSTTGSIAR